MDHVIPYPCLGSSIVSRMAAIFPRQQVLQPRRQQASQPIMNRIPALRSVSWTNHLRIFARHTHGNRKPKRPTTGFQGPEDHGREIYVFSHRRTDQVIYSFYDKLDGFHDLKQLPFNGKKTKPAKLRKDYWFPMATIKFPEGYGSVGRSVFQKLRELKHLHEVAWPDEVRYKSPEEYSAEDKKAIGEAERNGKQFRPVRSRLQRGRALNAQRKNAIADMAVVLAGQGSGNKIVKREGDNGADALHHVTVSWFNGDDKEYAEQWSENVTHELFEGSPYGAAEQPPTPQSEAGNAAAKIDPQPSAA